MYELLNIRNKFKGKRFYYCSFRDNPYSSTPVLRRVFIRLVTYVDEDMLLVGQDFRLRIPMKKLVTNIAFSMRVSNKQELDFGRMMFDTTPWRIISTEKQEVARRKQEAIQQQQEAAKQYREEAEMGNVKAQFKLAWCYEKGVGVKKDIEAAVRWYRKAAAQGDSAAQTALVRLGKR